MSLAWRLNNPDPSLASTVEFQLTAPGYAWLGMARSWDGTMLEGVGMAGSGPAVIAMPDSAQEPSGFYVNQFRLTARTAIGAVQTAHYTLQSAWARYDPGTDSSILSFARPLVPPDFADASEKAIIPTQPQTFIAACGTPGLPFGPHGPNNRLNFSLQLVPRRCSRNADCSGHGTCRGGADAPACFCDVGWAGSRCSACATGFFVSGTACLPSQDAAVTSRLKANVRFVLAVDFTAVVGPAGTLRYSRSAQALTADLASAVGVPAGRIRVLSLAAVASPLPGTYQQTAPPYTAASVDILPPLRPPPAAPAPPLSDAPAAAVAAQLARLAANPASVLFTGQLTQSLSTAAQPLAFSFGAIAPGEAGSGSAATPAYSYAVSIPRVNLTMEWVVNGTAGTAYFRVTRARAPGSLPSWIAVAFNDDASVVGSDAVVFEAAPDAGALAQYVVAAHSLTGMLAVLPGLGNAVLLSGQASGGTGGNVTTFEWMRPLRAAPYVGALALPLSTPISVFFAIGAGPLLTGGGGTHAASMAGGFAATLSTGRVGPLPTPAAATPSPSPSPGAAAAIVQEDATASARAAHGALMFLAYGVLAPLGVLLSLQMRGGRHEEAPHAAKSGVGAAGDAADEAVAGSVYKNPAGVGGPRKSGGRPSGLAHAVGRSAAGCCSTCSLRRAGSNGRQRLAPCWLRLHAALMTAAAILSTIAFIISLAMVPAALRMTTAHHVIGLLLWLMTIGQAFAGACRPAAAAAGSPPSPWRKRWYAAHRASGWIILSVGVLQTYLGLAAAHAHPVLFVLYSLLLAAVLLVSLKDYIIACGAVARCAACPAACRTFCCGEGDDEEEAEDADALDEEAEQAKLQAGGDSSRRGDSAAVDVDVVAPHTIVIADDSGHTAAGGIAAAMHAAAAADSAGADSETGGLTARRQDRVSLIAVAVLGHGGAPTSGAAGKPRRVLLGAGDADGSGDGGFGLEMSPVSATAASSGSTTASGGAARGSSAAGGPAAYSPTATGGAAASSGSAASRQVRAGARKSVAQSGSDGRFAPLRAAGGAGRRGRGGGKGPRGSRTGPGGLIAPRAGALDAGDVGADDERWEDDEEGDDAVAYAHAAGAHHDGAAAAEDEAWGEEDYDDEAWGDENFDEMAEGEEGAAAAVDASGSCRSPKPIMAQLVPPSGEGYA